RRHTRFSRDWSSDVCSSDLAPASAPKATPLHDADDQEPGLQRIPTGIGELDRVLGGASPNGSARAATRGGFVPGSAILLGGDPSSEERRGGRECRCPAPPLT